MTEQRKTILIVDDETGIRSLIHSAAQEFLAKKRN